MLRGFLGILLTHAELMALPSNRRFLAVAGFQPYPPYPTTCYVHMPLHTPLESRLKINCRLTGDAIPDVRFSRALKSMRSPALLTIILSVPPYRLNLDPKSLCPSFRVAALPAFPQVRLRTPILTKLPHIFRLKLSPAQLLVFCYFVLSMFSFQ